MSALIEVIGVGYLAWVMLYRLVTRHGSTPTPKDDQAHAVTSDSPAPCIAGCLFGATRAQSELEDALNIEFDHLGWDYYDESLEIHGAAPACRLSDSDLKVIRAAGFVKVYLNHADKWETHYTFAADGTVKSWRVSYPHNRGDGGRIMVEEFPPGWPADWLETNYVEVVPKEDESA